MEKIRKFFGSAFQGRFVHKDPDAFDEYIRQFEDGKEMQIEIKPFSKVRTSGLPGEPTNFNGYYWAVVVRMVADEMGELDQDYVHGLLQIAVGNFKVSPSGDKIPLGTKKMSGANFSDYCMRARMWANIPGNLTQHGIFIPQPHEYGSM